mgnify:FL=1
MCPMPGRFSRYKDDLQNILLWQPRLVVTVTLLEELNSVGAKNLPYDLGSEQILWRHLPIKDLGVLEKEDFNWDSILELIRKILSENGRVLCHCFGGCGRSGMITLRLMSEHGEDCKQALKRLRTVRACAVENETQYKWACKI